METSFSNFTTPDKNGNRRGKPRFKGFHYYKSFTYPQLDTRWYISLTLEDKTVPVTVVEIQPTDENTLGIDLGITNYVDLSNGERIENPRFFRKSAEKLARLQAKLANRIKGSKPGQIIKSKISKLHQFVARARLDFQFKTAHKLFDKCDVLILEDLSLKNLTRLAQVKTDIENGNLIYLPNGQAAKSGLNKSMLDASHGQFATVLMGLGN